MKNVYLIITDLHLSYKVKENRISYFKETEHVKRFLVELILTFKKLGYNVILLYGGDIFDNVFRDVEKALYEFDSICYLDSLADKSYSVIGNHELTYKKDNPFWTLVSNVNPEMENLPTKNIKPSGVKGVLNITDRLIDGNVVFNFNHYGTGVLKPIAGKYNFGLFHQDIHCSPAINSAKVMGLEPYVTDCINLDTNDVLTGYDHSFFFHFHKYYGKWKIDGDRIIQYLGSLGRPDVSQVKDTYLERTIPCVIVEDGNLVEVKDIKFNLMSEKECLKFDVIEKQKKKRKKKKIVKSLDEDDIIHTDVITTVKEKINSESVNQIIDYILEDKLDGVYEEILRRKK